MKLNANKNMRNYIFRTILRQFLNNFLLHTFLTHIMCKNVLRCRDGESITYNVQKCALDIGMKKLEEDERNTKKKVLVFETLILSDFQKNAFKQGMQILFYKDFSFNFLFINI